MRDHRGVQPRAVTVVCTVEFIGFIGVKELDEIAFEATSESKWTFRDWLVVEARENAGEGLHPETDDGLETDGITHPAAPNFVQPGFFGGGRNCRVMDRCGERDHRSLL